jgi:hypothetical protein
MFTDLICLLFFPSIGTYLILNFKAGVLLELVLTAELPDLYIGGLRAEHFSHALPSLVSAFSGALTIEIRLLIEKGPI